MNFSRRKIGHAHDNSADSKNVAGAHEPNVHTHFIVRFENDQGNRSLISIHDQSTGETRQKQAHAADGRLKRHRQGVPVRPPAYLRKFGSARLSRKWQTSWIEESLQRGYKLKEAKHDRLGKRPAVTEAAVRRSAIDRRRRT